jgi:hypothetical protein
MIFQEVHQQNDNGKDAFLGLAWSGPDAGLIVWLQIKGGRKYKLSRKPNRLREMDYRYRQVDGFEDTVANEGRHAVPINPRLRRIWSDSRPIFVLVQDPDDNELYFGNLARMADLAMPDETMIPLYPDLLLTSDNLDRFVSAARAEARDPLPPMQSHGGAASTYVVYGDDTIGLSREALEVIRREF